MDTKIGWGIVGLGNIAHSFAEDLALVGQGQLVAVASRSMEKAESFAEQYGSDYAFGTYQELFNCEEVDVVYIATPHTSHAELSIIAMNNGKHVLCEKPMGVNQEEVKRMVAKAKEKKVFLMEALWSRFNPSIVKVKQLVQEGVIGQISYLHADFAFFALERSEEGRLLNPALAGGSLLDIGIYPVFLSYLLLGLPQKVMATSKFYKTGVEIQTSMIFEYENAQAVLYSGLNSKSEMKAEISGSNGSVFLRPRWHETQGYTLEGDGDERHFDLPTTGKGYSHEIEEVHACLAHGQLESKLWSHNNSLELISLLDEIRKQTGIIFPFES